MKGTEMLADIRKRAGDKNIFDLRQIARAVGVSRPTGEKKEDIIEDIIKIASCELAPALRSSRGAPPKSKEYDKELVADIEACRNYFSAQLEGTGVVNVNTGVSDGTEEGRCAGILDNSGKYSFLRVHGCLPDIDDVFVHESFINRFNLREGDFIEGECRRKNSDEAAGLIKILSVNDYSPDSVPRRNYAELTPIYPQKRICVEFSGEIPARMIDMFAPIGLGQRAVVCGSANSGKTTLIKRIGAGISLNEGIEVIYFIVAGRPEEITDIERFASGEVFYTTFDMEHDRHVKAAEFVTTYCKNAVECGKNVVLIVEGLSKLGTAAKRLFSAAINAEEGGSLTIIADVAADGEYSSEYSPELISAANMRITLSDNLAEGFPVVDLSKTYTLNCELLQSVEERKTADILRKQSINAVIKLFKETENNLEIIEKNG